MSSRVTLGSHGYLIQIPLTGDDTSVLHFLQQRALFQQRICKHAANNRQQLISLPMMLIQDVIHINLFLPLLQLFLLYLHLINAM